ncbi:hypothetical protein GDO78_012123 [Eleutherodactylus coqui]|uniref:Uncharacterized protein n=1 Tax=Eleutherodactylus coqui TaxID=57060 RepID=A0A8J6F4W3_ELECQ|nr:hypothetical protein GDO78_012123 [Eleutherodactylus coqui]
MSQDSILSHSLHYIYGFCTESRHLCSYILSVLLYLLVIISIYNMIPLASSSSELVRYIISNLGHKENPNCHILSAIRQALVEKLVCLMREGEGCN